MEAQFVLRRQFRQDFGYVVATAEVMTVLAGLLRETGPMLDAGCGSGYLSRELARRGVSTFAVDCCDFLQARPFAQDYPIHAVYQRDALGDAASFVPGRFGAVLLAWPPLNQPFAVRVARAMLPGQWLVYEGEDAGGCTADDAFFEFHGRCRPLGTPAGRVWSPERGACHACHASRPLGGVAAAWLKALRAGVQARKPPRQHGR